MCFLFVKSNFITEGKEKEISSFSSFFRERKCRGRERTDMDLYGVKSKEDFDIEQGNLLYPGIGHGENELRWGFIRKVYGILTAQILLTTVVSAFTVLYLPLNQLLRGNSGLLIFLCFLPFVRKSLFLSL